MLFLALAVPAIYAYAASRGEIAKPRWLDEIGVAINQSLAAQPQAEIPSVDPIAAANVDEDLDYRIAQRTNSIEGWRAFLTAHPDGPHAQSARAELDKLDPSAPSSAQMAVQAPDTGAADTKIPSGNVSPPLASTGSDAATLASDEVCKGDEDRLQRLSNSPTSDGVIRLLIELRCEKLRPQLLLLAKRLDTTPAAPADAAQDASSNPPPAPAASKDASTQAAKTRTPGSQHRARPRVASHSSEPRRHANHEKDASLPPFLLSLFGNGSRNSTEVRRTRTGAGGH